MASKLVAPHGGKGLVCALLSGAERDAELEKAKGLKQIEIDEHDSKKQEEDAEL